MLYSSTKASAETVDTGEAIRLMTTCGVRKHVWLWYTVKFICYVKVNYTYSITTNYQHCAVYTEHLCFYINKTSLEKAWDNYCAQFCNNLPFS
jgi:hypothetical protein